MNAYRSQRIGRYFQWIAFKHDEISGLTYFQAPARLIEVALPSGIDGHRADRLQWRDALSRIQNAAAFVHISQDCIFNASQRIDWRDIVIGVQGYPQASSKGRTARV